MEHEGVVKFRGSHRIRSIDTGRHAELLCQLIAWREMMALTGLLGQEPGRYEGSGYGNVSARVGPRSAALGRRPFLITGTQTSGRRCIAGDDFALVERYDYDGNHVWSHGAVPPSSESMTHAALYDMEPWIRCVLHAHSPVLWRQARALRLPTTDPAIPYGTVEMARGVQGLYRTTPLPERRILAMGGHEDGILAFGRSPEEAGVVLLRWLARAYEAECGRGTPGLCSTPQGSRPQSELDAD